MQGFTHLLAQFDGHGAVRRFAEVPESCPVCAYYVNPRRLGACSVSPDDTAVQFVFQCPRDECRHVFVGEYRREQDGEDEMLHAFPPQVAGELRLVPA